MRKGDEETGVFPQFADFARNDCFSQYNYSAQTDLLDPSERGTVGSMAQIG
jgi:hypothetical protein